MNTGKDAREVDAEERTSRIGGVPFQPGALNVAVSQVLKIHRTHPRHIHFANAYSIALASKDPSLLRVLVDPAAMNFADGKPISWFSRAFQQTPRINQVRGPSFFPAALAASEIDQTVSHYFLGGTSHTLSELERKVRARFPNARVAGCESPPFRVLSEQEWRLQLDRIQASRATIVWVGLGTPKQDHVASRITHELEITTVAIGAAFDYLAETIREAPRFVSAIGVEWMFRLLTEPRRLWRRYLIGNPQFIYAVLRSSHRRGR